MPTRPPAKRLFPLFFFLQRQHPSLIASRLGASVTTVNTEIRTGDVLAGIGEQEGDRTHEVLGHPHLALGNEGGPLLLEIWVIIEDLLGPTQSRVSAEIQI